MCSQKMLTFPAEQQEPPFFTGIGYALGREFNVNEKIIHINSVFKQKHI